MHRGSVVLALVAALAVFGGACGGGGNSQVDAAVGDDAAVNPQRDAAAREDGLQNDASQRDAPAVNHDTGTSLIQCGTTYCNITAGEECCITGFTPTCMALNTCPGYSTIECDGPEDCPITSRPECCAQDLVGGGGTHCSAASECNVTNNVRLCRHDSDCADTEKCCGYAAIRVISLRYCVATADCPTSPATAGVACGVGLTCTSPDVCCMDRSAGTCGTTAACTAGLIQQCDGPEDCQADGGTQVCCGSISYNGAVSGGSSCVSTCTPTGDVGGTVCHVDGDCTGGKVCRTTGYAGYSIRLCM